MKYTFDVAFLPCEALKKHDARIVVDLLRATTQITTFFDMGGEVLVPVTEVDEAFAMKEKLGEDWKLWASAAACRRRASTLEIRRSNFRPRARRNTR